MDGTGLGEGGGTACICCMFGWRFEQRQRPAALEPAANKVHAAGLIPSLCRRSLLRSRFTLFLINTIPYSMQYISVWFFQFCKLWTAQSITHVQTTAVSIRGNSYGWLMPFLWRKRTMQRWSQKSRRNLLTSHTVSLRCQNHFEMINCHKTGSVGSQELATRSQIMGSLVCDTILLLWFMIY